MNLEKELVVGDNIKIGKRYAEKYKRSAAGKVITLVQGYFEHDNGLYTEEQTAPSIKEDDGEYSSIYHLFENDLSDFMDCEILNNANALK